jgi:hypothetical protein
MADADGPGYFQIKSCNISIYHLLTAGITFIFISREMKIINFGQYFILYIVLRHLKFKI